MWACQKIGFAVQTLNKRFRWTKATLYYFISLASSTILPSEKALYFGGFVRSHARADTSSRGFAAFSRVLSRLSIHILGSKKYLWAMDLHKFTHGFRVTTCLQANSSKYRQRELNETLSLSLGVTKFRQLRTKTI